MTPDDIVAAARATLGVPFVHQGRTLRGLDCVGVALHVANVLGVGYVDVEGYPKRPSQGHLEATFEAHVASGVLLRVNKEGMARGDFLLMKFKTDPQHVALWTGDTLIHSYANVGKVVEHRMDDEWAARIVRVYRFAGVEQ